MFCEEQKPSRLWRLIENQIPDVWRSPPSEPAFNICGWTLSDIFLLAFCIFAIVAWGLFYRRWGDKDTHSGFDIPKFKNTLTMMEDFYEGSRDWTSEQWRADRVRNVDRFWTGRPSERRKLFSGSVGWAWPEAVIGPFIAGRSPFLIYRLMKLYLRENRERWRVIVERERP